jgi:hypothetical protein
LRESDKEFLNLILVFMNSLSIENKIKFELVELNKWEELELFWYQIITVVSWKIKERIKWTLETFESSTFDDEITF